MTALARALLPLLAALAAAACGDSAAGRSRATEAPPPVAVAVATVEERALGRTLEVTGQLVADTRTEVAAETAARVVAVAVERGSVVRAGDALARLDREDALNRLREAEATERQTRERLGMAEGRPFDPRETPEARRARLTLERAEAEYRRYERLVEEGAVSRSEHDLKRMEYTTAREQLEATVNQMRELARALEAQQARVAMARKALADTVVRAPFDGLVVERHVAVGQYVERGTRVATLVRVDPLRVELAVPESAAAAVQKGQRVSFEVQTHPGRRFTGTIAYVGPALRAESRALVVEAVVPNGRGELRPGLFATARIELPAAAAGAVVPRAAVRTEAGVSRVWVVRDGRAEVRLVQVGDEVDGWVEVPRGVRPGERVVLDPPERLGDGAPVAERREGGR